MPFTCPTDVSNFTNIVVDRRRAHRTESTDTSAIILLTPTELVRLRYMVIAATSISIGFCLVIVFLRWFRRWFRQKAITFRDQLHITLFVVLCIRSIVQLLHPSISIHRPFFWDPATRCFTLGFFLLVLLRMSDYWILINVIHNALLVLNPTSIDVDHGGLYRFRHTVYGLSIVFPFTVGALAFTNYESTFVNFQTRCFIPFRPARYYWGLNWGFDYFLTTIIFTLHLCMFISIRRKVKQFQSISCDNPDSFCSENLEAGPRSPSQVVPPPFLENLSSSSSSSSSASASPHPSHSYQNPNSNRIDTFDHAHNFSPSSSPPSPALPSTSQQHSYLSPNMYNPPNPSISNASEDSANHQMQQLTSELQNELDDGVENCSHNEGTVNSAMAYYEKDLRENPLKKQRKRVLRQSKVLFAYPAVFFVMWFLPQLRYIVTLANSKNECSGSCKNFAYIAIFCDNFAAIFLTLCDLVFECYQGVYVFFKKKKYNLIVHYLKKPFVQMHYAVREKT
ncbi:G-protein coupled receptor Git3 [Schizosaccharomyces octosporus yFS286]|uniref:G-protein coupled receptor Git3 n=1 Tax=Schizosaccharomyces octosporus (strain yFS286) TaxID=483514 RepID=S9Q0G3_SCHOY|nr:G-protein coupled receptor Git3 [Schizosaccharomyces octosporus yFS286]EPX73682.1 G-protein coupled receptor Git3 [Schizosaccharomyces octosporus yFS286]